MHTQTRHIPLRKCVICGRRTTKRALTRFVVPREGSLPVPDEAQTASGRGMYVCAERRCRETFSLRGVKKKAKGRRL